MAREPDLQVIPLLCPRCGAGLSAEEGSVLFPCRPCALLWEPREQQLVRQELQVQAGEGSVYLSFWLFPFRVTTREGEITTLVEFRRLTGNISPLEPERQGVPPTLFVPAVAGMPPHLMVRAGRLLTVRSPRLTIGTGFPDRLMAIGTGARDAACMAETIVLATMGEERLRNVSFLRSVQVAVGEGRLCAIPFQERGEQFLQTEWVLEV
jgi:hypothetical protein